MQRRIQQAGVQAVKQIFISYALSDADSAVKMYDILKEAGLKPWMDKKDILPGEPISHTVQQAIHKSSYFLALLSKESLYERGRVHRELNLAIDKSKENPAHKIFIIPVRLDDCKVDQEFLLNIQPLDLFQSPETELEKLICVFIPENWEEKNTDSPSPFLQIDTVSVHRLIEKSKKSESDPKPSLHSRKRLILSTCLLLQFMVGLWYISPLSVNMDDFQSYEPDLYGLCIGITNYREYNLKIKYATANALSIKNELETRANPLFKHVHIRSLTDKQASTHGIQAAFKEISSKIRSKDVFVLYMSGYGKALDTRYHFIPWEMGYENEKSIRQKSLSHDKIQELMAMIPVQKCLIILDTCYPGSLALASSKGMEEKTAIDRLMRATGRTTIAAISDTTLADEGYNGHSILAHAVLEGLRAHADRKGNKDGATSTGELANFIQDEVSRITYDKFRFEQITMHSIVNSFSIGCCEGYDGHGCKP